MNISRADRLHAAKQALQKAPWQSCQATSFSDPEIDAPVLGDRYERRFIERWLAHGCTRCPCSGQSLVPPVLLMPNVALRKCIEEWADDHATWLLVSATAP